MIDKMYPYGELHDVTLKVTFKKTYKVKALTQSDAVDIAKQRVFRRTKAMRNNGYDFLHVEEHSEGLTCCCVCAELHK